MLHENPAGERSKSPILSVLEKYIPLNETAYVLEIASGPGCHVQSFAAHFPKSQFQTSEIEPAKFASLNMMCKTMANIAPPLTINIARPVNEWRHLLPWDAVDAMISINLFHICRLDAVQGMFKAAGALLKSTGFLLTYGPYAKDGKIDPECNALFNACLRKENPEWGLRDIKYLKQLAKENGLELKAQYEMPAYNDALIFGKI